jgi:predicted Zn-dependent protease
MRNWILLFVLVWMYGCGSVPVTGRKQLVLVSDKELLTLSLQQYGDFIKTAPKSADAKNTAMVVKVGQNLANAVTHYYQSNGLESTLDGFSWEFNLIEDEQVNAFCMPGGKIVVYTGILPYTQTETGLAVVLGHEVSHALAKHANERMSQQMVVESGGALLGIALSKSSSEMQQIGQTVFGLGAQVGVMLPFSRKHELEADQMGLIFMAIAGYDPSEAVPFWERMGEQGGGTLELLSTHPSDKRRVEEVRKYLPEALKYYNKEGATR